MVERNVLIGGGLILALVLLGGFSLSNTGGIFDWVNALATNPAGSGVVIQSISATTLNNQPAHLISLLATPGADTLKAVLGNSQFAAFPWPGDKPAYELDISASKSYDKLIYTATERTGTNRAITYFALKTEYTGLVGKSFSTFQSECGPNNLAFDVGDLTPHFYCFERKTAWIVSDFDRVAGIYDPQVNVFVDIINPSTRALISHSSTKLTRTNTVGTLASSVGEIGKVQMSSLQTTFLTPPASSGVKMLLDANAMGPAFQIGDFVPVDGSVDTQVRDIYDRFNLCLQQAQRTPGGLSLGILPVGPVIQTSGAYYQDKVNSCVNSLKSGVLGLTALTPTGDFAPSMGVDYSKYAATRTITLPNKFTIPQLLIWTYDSKIGLTSIGVSQPNAIPASASCENIEIPSGTTSAIRASIQNGPTAGALYWSFTCPAPLTVRTASGTITPAAGAMSSFTIDVSAGNAASSGLCTLSVQSTDLSKSVSGTCTLSNKQICTNTPRAGFYLDKNCIEFCPKTANDCLTGQTFDAGSCTCTGAPPPPPPPPNNTTAPVCLPIVQTLKTSTVGGSILGGGTPVYSCENDLFGLGAVLVGLALVGGYMKQRR